VEEIEQPGGGFNQVAGGAERRVPDDGSKADEIFAAVGARRIQSQWLRRRVVALQLSRSFDRRAVAFRRFDFDGSASEQSQRTASYGDNRGFDAALGPPSVDDERDAAAQALQDMACPGRADRSTGIGRRGGEGPTDGDLAITMRE